MSPTSNKRRGAAIEQQVVDWLRVNGHPHAERRRLAGVSDKGDIAGVWTATRINSSDCPPLVSEPVVIEVKGPGRGQPLDLPGWLRELDREKVNAGAAEGWLVIRLVGVTDVGEWAAVRRVRDAL